MRWLQPLRRPTPRTRAPPPSPDLANASITIQPSSGMDGGTVVSWPSLDHGNAISYLIAGTIASDWDTVSIFAAPHGSHQFFISHPIGTIAPPEANPFLETKDAVMIADLEAGLSDFNADVAAAATARNTPTPSFGRTATRCTSTMPEIFQRVPEMVSQ
jgi:hypothetical protein